MQCLQGRLSEKTRRNGHTTPNWTTNLWVKTDWDTTQIHAIETLVEHVERSSTTSSLRRPKRHEKIDCSRGEASKYHISERLYRKKNNFVCHPTTQHPHIHLHLKQRAHAMMTTSNAESHRLFRLSRTELTLRLHQCMNRMNVGTPSRPLLHCSHVHQ